MRLWKQLVAGFVLAVVALCLWATLSPDARRLAEAWGVPAPVLAMMDRISPKAMKEAAAKPGQGQGQGQGNAQGQGGQRNNATLVVTASVGRGTVNDQLNAIGNGEAIQSVVVMPQSSGTISEILISSGERVRKGQVIARLDDEEQIIARNKAEVALKSAREKSSLYNNIKSSVSRMDVFDAGIAEETAKLQLDTATLELGRRSIVAPIDGVVGIVAVNVGDNVTTQTSVVTIDDRSEILVNFWAPERFVPGIHPGMAIEASSIARPGQVFEGAVEAVDNRLDEASRTMRIRARIENPEDQLRAGMSFAVSMRFSGESYPTVDPLSVQWDAEGSYVWRIVENKAEKVRIRIVQRNPDAVLVAAGLNEGDNIVTEGLQRVRSGGQVRIAGVPAKVEVAGK